VDLAIDDAGYLFLAGSTRGTTQFDALGASAPIGLEDTFVVRVDPAGDLDWLGRWGGGVTSFALNPHLGVRTVGAQTLLALSGNVFGTANFGSGKSVTDSGGSDAYAVRMMCGL
jgi:hypothetical protein